MKTKIWIKNWALFFIFGLIYFALESIWKGSMTHWTMFILGGIVGFLIGDINEKISWDMPFLQQCTIGMGVAIFSEAVAGVILNIILNLNLWHYTTMTFFWGQCSLPFCVIWFFLSSFAIVLDDIIRWKIFGEDQPHYRWR